MINSSALRFGQYFPAKYRVEGEGAKETLREQAIIRALMGPWPPARLHLTVEVPQIAYPFRRLDSRGFA